MDDGLLTLFNRITQDFSAVRWVATLLSSSIFGFAMLGLFTLLMVQRLRPVWLVVLLMTLVVALSDGVGHHILKPLFGRQRPCQVRVDLFTPLGCGTGLSLPSLHAANAMAAALVVALLLRSYASPVTLLAVLVGLSRIFVGVHYPTDVLAGFAWGAFVALPLTILAARHIDDRNKPLRFKDKNKFKNKR